jgi:hypothetical protein
MYIPLDFCFHSMQTFIHPCFAGESSGLDALHTLADLSVNILQPSSIVESGLSYITMYSKCFTANILKYFRCNPRYSFLFLFVL